ncbi:hypothetical protein Q667_19175 [Marinobacter sp. C1S70]|uniref:hypothetical protein n=1 Tax=Marinobacter sp. C1S70 TaxID=1396859 RepID=UPI0003B90AC4|nr:hypothetical protein [Marinobacter sp. C1S70]ERS82403.1 hypothetical protein Q667_19175 [Marinobacter sp. C1S70]
MVSENVSVGQVNMVIKTSALEFDDRLRKEVISCQELGYKVSISCLLDDNQRSSGEVWKGVEYRSFSLWSRRWLPGHKFVVVHVLEFVLRLLLSNWGLGGGESKKKVVWIHDPVLMPFLPVAALMRLLRRVDRIVWDQHELPPESWLSSVLFKPLLRQAFRVPDCLVVANESRARYLESCQMLEADSNVFILHNYADDEYASQPVEPLNSDLKEWLNGERYLLVQSGGTSLRHAETVFSALFSGRWPDLKVVFVGGADSELVERFQVRYPERFERLVWVEGKVPQLSLARFADHAVASVIFYRASSPNQIYCEPNRMYQALCRGLPVIVGNNPPMADVVRETEAGVILEDDGGDAYDLVAAVRTILLSEQYRDNAKRLSGKFRWHRQNAVVAECLKY